MAATTTWSSPGASFQLLVSHQYLQALARYSKQKLYIFLGKFIPQISYSVPIFVIATAIGV